MHIQLVIAALLVSILVACSLPAENSPLPLGPAPTFMPATPITGLDQPGTAPPAIAPTKNIGTPVPGWEDIPIMPGAYDSELEDLVYLYSVDAPVEEVEEYYLVKMDVNGWILSNREQMEVNPSAGPATILDFQKDDRSLNVMLVTLAEGDATAVILSLLGP